MTDNTQPLALMLADRLHHEQPTVLRIDAEHAGEELRRQHARIAELEAQLEAIGAGGVSGPLVGRASLQSTSFDAADMATASAQGFRDGVASLSANAGEPVTQWQKRHPDDEDGRWQNTDAGDAKYWESRPGWQIRALYAAPPTAQAEGWKGLTEDERDKVVSDLIDYGGSFVTPLYSVVEGIEKILMRRNSPPTSAEGVEHG